MKRLLIAFLFSTLSATHASAFASRCEVNHFFESDCVNQMCNQGGFNCGFGDELHRVIVLCRHVEGECIDVACRQGGFTCNFRDDLTTVAELCRDVDASCVDVACNRGGYSCQFESDLTAVLRTCRY